MEFHYYIIRRTRRKMNISSIVVEFEQISIPSMVEPSVEHVIEPSVEHVIEPVIEPSVEPVIEPSVEPVIEHVMEPSVEPSPLLEPVINTTILIEPPPNPEKQEKESIDALVRAIQHQREKGVKEYHFRPVMIDESINVKVPFSYNGHETLVPYILYHNKFASIHRAVNMVKKVFSTFKQKNGDIMSEVNYNDMKLEEIVIPYSPNEICCVCFENTTDTTKCGHYICFGCRDKCCVQQKTNCPICREPKALSIYNNVMHLINNSDYAELQEIFKNKIIFEHQRFEEREPEDDSSSSSSSSSSEEEEEEVDSIS